MVCITLEINQIKKEIPDNVSEIFGPVKLI